MAISKKRVVESADSSSETLREWAWRRPVLACVLLVCAVSVSTLGITWIWSATGGGKSGPKVIKGSPWDKRKAPGGPNAE